MGAALGVKPEFGSAQGLRRGGRDRVGSAEAPAPSFRPCRCLDARSLWPVGRYFPLRSQHVVKQRPLVFYPDLPGASSFPAAALLTGHAQEGSRHLPPLLPVAIARSQSSSSMLLCASASWDLASVCQGYAPLPLQLLSARLHHPKHPFLLPEVALYIPFPELFRPDLY